MISSNREQNNLNANNNENYLNQQSKLENWDFNNKKREVTCVKKEEGYFSGFANWVGSFFYNNEKSIYDLYFEEAPKDIYWDKSNSFVKNVDKHLKQNKTDREFVKKLSTEENPRLDEILKACEILEADNNDTLFQKKEKEQYLSQFTKLLGDQDIVLRSGEYYFKESLKHAFEDGNKNWYSEFIGNNKSLRDAFDLYLDGFLRESSENQRDILTGCGLGEEQSDHVVTILENYSDKIDARKLMKYVVMPSHEIEEWESSIFNKVWNAILNNKGKIAVSLFLSMGNYALTQNVSTTNKIANDNITGNQSLEVVSKDLKKPSSEVSNPNSIKASSEATKTEIVKREINRYQQKFDKAVKENHWLKVAKMLQKDVNKDLDTSIMKNVIEREGPNLISYEIQRDIWPNVIGLLEIGAKEDPNNPVLKQAIEAKLSEMQIGWLMEAGASFGAEGEFINLAIKHNQWYSVEVLLQKGAKEEPNNPVLNQAIKAGLNAWQIGRLVEAGASIHANYAYSYLILSLTHWNWPAIRFFVGQNGVTSQFVAKTLNLLLSIMSGCGVTLYFVALLGKYKEMLASAHEMVKLYENDLDKFFEKLKKMAHSKEGSYNPFLRGGLSQAVATELGFVNASEYQEGSLVLVADVLRNIIDDLDCNEPNLHLQYLYVKYKLERKKLELRQELEGQNLENVEKEKIEKQVVQIDNLLKNGPEIVGALKEINGDE